MLIQNPKLIPLHLVIRSPIIKSLIILKSFHKFIKITTMKYFITTLLFLLPFSIYGQQIIEENDSINIEKIKRFSLGARVGVPNIASINGELILPIAGNRISAYIDYGSFNFPIDETDIETTYTEFGVNFYFNTKGKGFYLSAGSGSLSTDYTFNNLEFDDGAGQIFTGKGSTDLNIESTNLKLGLKTGGTFYFRLEAGFGFTSFPETLTFNASSNNITQSFTEETPSIPGVSSNGILVGNIGLGFSF